MISLLKILKGGARDGRWWYATVHLVTFILGAGVLGIPSAMVYLGWWGGMTLLGVSFVITLCTLWQMVHLHHLGNERIDKFPDLGEKAFGLPGWYFMFVLQIILQSSVNAVYLVTGGFTVSLIITGLKDFEAIILFAAAQYLVCLIPDFAALTWLSTVSMFMAIGYSTIIWISALYLHDHRLSISYQIPQERRLSRTFNALGQMAFSFGGQNIVLEVQSLLRAPSTKPMWHGALVSYLILALCYFPVAGVGYWAFGNLSCYGNVLQLLHSSILPRWVFYTASVLLSIHLTSAYQVYALPVYEIFEVYSFPRLRTSYITGTERPRRQILTLVFARYLYITCTCFIAVLIPFYKNVIALFGGLVVVPTAYFLPSILWLRLKKPERFSLSWIANMACIVFGVTLTLLSFIGGLWEIIVGFEAGTHRPFHFLQLRNCSLT